MWSGSVAQPCHLADDFSASDDGAAYRKEVQERAARTQARRCRPRCRGRRLRGGSLAGAPLQSRFEGDLMLGAHVLRLTAPGLAVRGRAWLRARVPPLSGLGKTAAAIAAGAPIRPGERVLASVRQVSGEPVIATDRAAYCQSGPGTGRPWSRLGWEDVDQVLWDDELGALTLTRTPRGGLSRVVLRLPRSYPLVEYARERVTATTLGPRPGAVPGQGLRVADRAPPTRIRPGEVGAGTPGRHRRSRPGHAVSRGRRDRRAGGRPRPRILAAGGHAREVVAGVMTEPWRSTILWEPPPGRAPASTVSGIRIPQPVLS